MDKELPETFFSVSSHKTFIRVSESNLPGTGTLKGNVVNRHTIRVEDLADRLKKDGCPYRKETLISAYRLMVQEIYKATGEGFNVDFDLGRTELTVNGSFTSTADPFDSARHTLIPRLRPSPRLRQVAAHIPAENTGPDLFENAPRPNEITVDKQPYRHKKTAAPFNELPAGEAVFVSVFGQRLRLMGDLPDVGITLRCLETGEEYPVDMRDLVINSRTRLCFIPRIPFTPGEWEVVIGTQYNPSYRLYKQVRTATLPFIVR